MPWRGTSGLGYAPVAQGSVAPGWERVKQAFETNFTDRNDIGSAVCVYHKGQKVVDLWCGESRNDGAQWQNNTLTCIFSQGKGIAALSMLMLHSRGCLDFDAPVMKYWPEFGQNGKETITVRQLFAHQAGLAPIGRDMTIEDLADPEIVGAAIAETVPAWETGTKQGYMGITLGWYMDQIMRRCDPKGRSISRFVAEEVCPALDLEGEFYLGLPSEADLPRTRVADFSFPSPFELVRYGVFQKRADLDTLKRFLFKPSSYTHRAFKNPKVTGDPNNYNTEALRRLEMPAANAFATARFVASFYNAFVVAANGGPNPLGFSQESFKETLNFAGPAAFDETLRTQTRFWLGFQWPHSEHNFGSDDRAFGHTGAGGSFGFADPRAGVAYSYAMRVAGLFMHTDPRDLALRQAVYDVLAELGCQSRPQPPETKLKEWLKKPDDLYFRTTCFQWLRSKC